MVLTTSGNGASWLTISGTSVRGPVSGQGSGTTTLPSSFSRGDGHVTVHGFICFNNDAAPQTITIRDRTGAAISGMSYSIAAGARRAIWLSNKPGLLFPIDSVLFLAATPASWTESTNTLTRVGAFTNYTFVAGDLVEVDGGDATPGFYEVASRTDADNIVLMSSIKPTSASPTNITGRLRVFGGVTVQSSNANLTGTLFFDRYPNMSHGAYWMNVTSATPTHPLDGHGTGTTTLSPLPAPGRGRTGCVLHSYVLTASPVANRTLTINGISGGVAGGGFTFTIPSGSAVGTSFDLGPPVRGRDFYSAEGLFAASIDNADASGHLSYSVPGLNLK